MERTPSEKKTLEFSAISIITGIVLSLVFGAANAYLGLRVGMTIKDPEEFRQRVYAALSAGASTRGQKAVAHAGRSTAESLHDGWDELTAFQRLEVPSTLNTSFLSTNFIENDFNNVRRKIGRVKR